MKRLMVLLAVVAAAAVPVGAQCVNCCTISTPSGPLLGCCASVTEGGQFCTLTGRNLCMTMYNCQDPVSPPGPPTVARYLTLEISAWKAEGAGWNFGRFPSVVTAEEPAALRTVIASLGGVSEDQVLLKAFEYSIAAGSWAPEGGMVAGGTGYMTRGDIDPQGVGPTRLRVCEFRPEGVPTLRADRQVADGRTLLVSATLNGDPAIIAVHLVELAEEEWLDDGEDLQASFVETFEAKIVDPAYGMIGAGAAGPCE